MLTRAFIVYGGDIPAVTLAAVEGRQQWHRDILPSLKRAVTALVGHRVPWSDIGIDGIPTEGDPVEWYNARPQYTRIILRADGSHVITRPASLTED